MPRHYYQWIPRNRYGVGVRYPGYFPSTIIYRKKLNVRLHYVGPEFVMYQQPSRKWIFRESFSIGYACYSENVENHSISVGGFGFHADLSMEYKLSQHIGIGAGIGVYLSSLNSMDGFMVQSAEDERKRASFSTASIHAGFYF